ncbi:hypothetical protein N9100_02530, partial [Gammaproteobacteria bacterium]|nr:hypothetical protein [Gammaproteobacteria bacterium]
KSDMGITAQQSQDYALEELKKQAAKLGANGVLLTNVGTEKESYVGGTYVPLATGGGYVMPYGGTYNTEALSGEAIFVISE